MNNMIIALMFGAGVAAFVWTKVSRRTGNANPGQVYIVAGVAGLAAFVFLWTFLKFVLNIS